MFYLLRSALPALLLALSFGAAAERPMRIVSIGLCTDQLALLLADREQIASVSVLAADEDMSYLVDRVGDLPLNDGSVEQVVRHDPDLVITSQFTAWDTARFLRRLGYRVEELPQAKSVAEIYHALELIGSWTGNPARAAAAIEEMRERLGAIRARYADRPEKSVILYAPNGFTVGSDTLEHDVFINAGYRNLAAEFGIEGFAQIPLERLVAADPDMLMIDRQLSRPLSIATGFVTHPVIERMSVTRERLEIPLPLRICAGPMIVDAIEMMAARR